ncbi:MULTISPECIES: hypothetical protein [Gordonibacter]|uniref:Uncharacterized protein n=1 Tax=Gordonibacter faecis TaxID=3047475 RepID=A0ABT7DQ24_9ACTN|nr:MULTISPECIES: hypothetical protein [unclassified Gordonibacter]MDJ1651655.1 hypothetical protein [Gordonibacter sp. KGMB12511]HIW77079.1 hypothetical protein [Candidatus Gordonibacter avicola]
MKQTFTIDGTLAGQNEITKSNRTNYHAGAQLKKREQERVVWAIKQAHLKPFSKPVSGCIYIVCPNMRKDRDNIEGGAKKVILDALQEMGIIKRDSFKLAYEFPTKCVLGKDPRIVVMITDEERTIDHIPYWTQLDSDNWMA